MKIEETPKIVEPGIARVVIVYINIIMSFIIQIVFPVLSVFQAL